MRLAENTVRITNTLNDNLKTLTNLSPTVDPLCLQVKNVVDAVLDSGASDNYIREKDEDSVQAVLAISENCGIWP